MFNYVNKQSRPKALYTFIDVEINRIKGQAMVNKGTKVFN